VVQHADVAGVGFAPAGALAGEVLWGCSTCTRRQKEPPVAGWCEGATASPVGGRSTVKRLLEWLIDLKDIRLGRDAPLSVQWELPLPAWVLLALILVAVACIATVYWRERGSMARRVVLGTLRLGLVALLVAVLCRPSLVLQRNRVEPAHVALVVDRSLSMGIKDRHDADETARIARVVGFDDVREVEELTRLEVAVAALRQDGWAALSQILLRNGVKLVSFADTVETLTLLSKGEAAEAIAKPLEAIPADGVLTDFSSALGNLLNRPQGMRLAAIVLASDGRFTSNAQLEELLRAAADRQIPIYPIRIGSASKEIDLEVFSAKTQSVVFANDFLLVEAAISAGGAESPLTATVRLFDEQANEAVDEKEVVIDPTQGPARVELSAKPKREGDVRYRIQVEPRPGERDLQNNQEVVDVHVLADRLKVLYVEGYPRFEYRFLKNALLREKSVELSVLLLEADDNFVQEGAESLRRFPDTVEELARFHVILFGDVDPNGGWLTASQLSMLLDFVGQRGVGFGLVAGARNAPHKFAGTPLERLIPINIDPQGAGPTEVILSRGFQGRIAPAGRESRLFRFVSDAQANEQIVSSLPELFWTSPNWGSKPGASVLLEHPEKSTASGPLPIVVLGRYGAGKIFFQGTDDSWRWRRHTGELLYDGYWVRLMRELMNSSLASADSRYSIRTDRRRYPYGMPVRVQVEVLDPRWTANDQATINLRVVRLTDPKEQGPASAAENVVQVHRLSAQSNSFEGNFLPPGPGTFTVTASDTSGAAVRRTASAVFRVEKPDLELRDRDADHQMLTRIASMTGGKMLEISELASRLGEIPDRSVQIPDDITESLWDSRLVFVLFILMISIEWGLRKAFGLL
jgi:hypothetical protein